MWHCRLISSRRFGSQFFRCSLTFCTVLSLTFFSIELFSQARCPIYVIWWILIRRKKSSQVRTRWSPAAIEDAPNSSMSKFEGFDPKHPSQLTVNHSLYQIDWLEKSSLSFKDLNSIHPVRCCQPSKFRIKRPFRTLYTFDHFIIVWCLIMIQLQKALVKNVGYARIKAISENESLDWPRAFTLATYDGLKGFVRK